MREEMSENSDEIDSSFEIPIGSPELGTKGNIIESPHKNSSLKVLIDSRLVQLKSLTPTNDKTQVDLIGKVMNIKNPIQQVGSLLDYFIQKMSSMNCDMAKLQNELKISKEEQKIAESRSSRLLLHLQQNVKLIAQIATNDGQSTLADEAVQNIQSLDSIQLGNHNDYIKQINAVFNQKKDNKLSMEVFELLKQEISINTLLRRQTKILQEKSNEIADQMNNIKQQLQKATSGKKIEQLKQQINKQGSIINELCTLSNCTSEELPNTISHNIEQIKMYETQVDQIKKKLKQVKDEQEQKMGLIIKENDDLKTQLSLKEKTNTNITKAKQRLVAAIGQDVKGSDDIECLVSAANHSIKIVNEHKAVCKVLDQIPGKLVKKIGDILAENEELKRIQEQNSILLAKQTETIQELRTFSEKTQNDIEVYNSNHDESKNNNDSRIEYSSMESDLHFGELNDLRLQFSTIGRELEELQNQMKEKLG